MSDPVQSLFSASSIGTYAGASAAVVVLTNTCRVLVKTQSPIPGFLFSLLIAYAGAVAANALTEPLGYLLAVLNGCLLFCSSLGIQQTVVGVKELPPADTIRPNAAESPKFWSGWFRRKG